MQFSAPHLPCKFVFLSFITHMKCIYTLLSLSLLSAWTSTFQAENEKKLGKTCVTGNRHTWLNVSILVCHLLVRHFSVLPSNKPMRHIIKEYMPALFQQTAWCLMPSTGGCIPFYAVTAFSLQGVAWKDHWMLMNNKMCHSPLEFIYLSYTVKKTCLFSSACIYMCVKIRTVKPGHMLRQYVVLLVFFSLLLLHTTIHPFPYKK